MPQKPEQLGFTGRITAANGAPTLPTDGFATNNHRFINVWAGVLVANTTDAYTTTFWVYKTGIGWVVYTDVEPIFVRSLQANAVHSLELRGSAERIYVQLSGFTGTPSVALLVEGVTYDSTDPVEGPERLYTANNWTTSTGAATLAQSFDAKGHRFLNVWFSLPGFQLQVAVSLYKEGIGFAGLRDGATTNVWIRTAAQGCVLQIETRGADRVFISQNATLAPVSYSYTVDGVTYGG